jgi:hypothetical protein
MTRTQAAHRACPVELKRWVKPLMSHLHRPTSRVLRPFCAALLCLLFLPSAKAAAHPRHCEARARHAHLSLAVAALGSWEPVDERTLLVWAPAATRAHLLHLSRPLAALTHSPILTMIDGDHDGVITACGHDGITVSDGSSERALIRSIEYLSVKRTVELDRRGWRVTPIEARLTPPRRPASRAG